MTGPRSEVPGVGIRALLRYAIAACRIVGGVVFVRAEW